MALVVGTDTYATAAELTTYATARGITLTEDGEVLLIKAMDYLEPMNFNGDKADSEQPLQWPRINVYLPNGLYVDSATVPSDVKRAQMMLAIDADSYDLTGSGAAVASKSVGDVSITYANGSGGKSRPVAALGILSPYLANAGFSWVTRA